MDITPTAPAPTKRSTKPFNKAEKPASDSGVTHPCGPFDKCRNDAKVILSLYAYPTVVRQVGDAVNYYFKITNITDKLIEGPIDFYMSGSDGPIASIDSLAANGYYDLLVTDYVDEVDMTRKFIVVTIWARLRSTGCLLGNYAETVVSVESLESDIGKVQFADPKLVIIATDNHLDIKVSVDIINLSSTLDIDALLLDFQVIFGKDTQLTYLINGLPSDLFILEQGKLRLAPGKTIPFGARETLTLTNTDKTINLDGYCDKECTSTFSWRLTGQATNNTTIPWVGQAV